MRKTVLIVDDNAINRELLKNALETDYDILEAENGEIAIELMLANSSVISAVLLDVVMPVMDGYDTLRHIRDDAQLAQIPVIFVTGSTDEKSRTKALSLGASDFLVKPFNPEIIQHCLKNNIALRETTSIINTVQRDSLTGLYNRETFFEKVSALVGTREPGYYVMGCFDVDSFKVINDQYGTGMGDEVLKHIARETGDCVARLGGVIGRLSDDNFAMFYPRRFADSDDIKRNHQRAMNPPCLGHPITVRIGRYIVNDTDLSPSAMYDRAALAQYSIKGKYGQLVAYYDEELRDSLLREQAVVADMTDALKGRQFEVWFQPQYDLSTEELVGAEALVRWRHPAKGLVPPVEFIPIFEKNGFVYELDKYVWEETCRLLRKWSDEGHDPLPVSVNISRYDLLRADFMETLAKIVEKYNIEKNLLRLEITESAFAESAEHIVGIVKALVALGYTVEIDDFGSGYSSLNTLKTVPAQIVKLDMKFLEDDEGSGRGGNILESVVRMTKWLGIALIAEGVETRPQADFLKSIGCGSAQGYLFAKPMTADAYETHCRGAAKKKHLLTLETVENLDNNLFWSPESLDSLMFNTYAGAACIWEYCNGRLELVRVTEKYVQMFGSEELTAQKLLSLDFMKYAGNREYIDFANEQTARGGDFVGEFLFLDLPGCPHETWLRSTMRIIALAGDRRMIYCLNENITAQREAERQERLLKEQLQGIMDNVNCGISAVTFDGDKVEYLFANDRYYELLGYTREQYVSEVGNDVGSTILASDRDYVFKVAKRVYATGVSEAMEYRLRRRDGNIVWMRSSMNMTRFEGVGAPVQLAILSDITAEKLAARELLDNLPNGAGLYEYDGVKLTVVHLNKRYWELVERGVNEAAAFPVDAIHSDDVPVVLGEISAAVREQRDICCDIRIRYGKDDYRRFHLLGRVLPKREGVYSIYVSYELLTDEEIIIRDTLPTALDAMISMQTDCVFVKDRNLRFISCSPAAARFAGLESSEEIIGKTDFDVFERDIAQQYYQQERQVLDTGLPIIDKVNRLPSADGSMILSSGSIYPLLDSQGNIAGLFGISRDITHTVESEAQLALLKESIPGGYVTYALKSDGPRPVYFSDSLCALFGCTREEYAAAADIEPLGRVFDEDRPALLTAVKDLRERDIPIKLSYRIHVKGGGYRWVSAQCSQLRRIGGQTIFHAALFDVTEKQEAAHKTAVLAQQMQALLRSINGAVSAVTFDADGKINVIFANDQYYEMLGCSREAVESGELKLWSVVHPDDRERIKECVGKMMEDHIPTYYEYRCIKADGNVIHVRCDAAVSVIDGVEGDVLISNIVDVTQEKANLEKLRISGEEARLAIEHGKAMVCKYDVATRTLTFPKTDTHISAGGSFMENVPYGNSNMAISPETRDAYIGFYEMILRGEKTGRAVFQKQSAAGWRWIDARFTTVFSDDGKPVSAVTSFFDVTEETEKEAVYKKWQQSLSNRKPETYMLFRGNISKNTVFDSVEGTLLPISYPDELRTFDQQVAHYTSRLVHPDDREWYLAYLRSDALLARYYRGGQNDVFEYRELTADGGYRWIRCTVELVEYPNSVDVQSFLLYEDIDDIKRAELELQTRAERDPLTGVLNRATFAARADKLISDSAAGVKHALLMLDVDNFKYVNDTFGHGAGDQTLVETAETLRGVLRRDDLLARLGGDEFVIFLADIPEEEIVGDKARQICQLIRRRFSDEAEITASIGVAVSPADGMCFEALYKNADSALYHVKNGGKDSFAFYHGNMTEEHPEMLIDRMSGHTAAVRKPAVKQRMLVVDDNQTENAIMASLFADSFIVDRAPDGETALQLMHHYGTAISVVLLDLMMPDISGLEVLKRMQDSQILQHIPVIVVSGAEDQDTCIHAIRAGATDFVTKPYDPEVLRVRVNSAISKVEVERLRAKNSMLEYQARRGGEVSGGA